MNLSIINNQRITYYKDIPHVLTLYNFTQELDSKYNVDSSDTDNSFGIIQLNKAPVSELYESNIYFLLFGYSSDITAMPKYEKIPPFQEAVLLDQKGNVGFLTSPDKNEQKNHSIVISPQDQERLIALRQKAYAEIQTHLPQKPIFSDNANTIKDYDQILEDQGFASGVKHFEIDFFVADRFNQSQTRKKYELFTVSYERIGPNKTAHFATTYKLFQNQEELQGALDGDLAYQFYQKWDIFHNVEMTRIEFDEMEHDLIELMAYYRYEINDGLSQFS